MDGSGSVLVTCRNGNGSVLVTCRNGSGSVLVTCRNGTHLKGTERQNLDCIQDGTQFGAFVSTVVKL
jgi:hypothetical protein